MAAVHVLRCAQGSERHRLELHPTGHNHPAADPVHKLARVLPLQRGDLGTGGGDERRKRKRRRRRRRKRRKRRRKKRTKEVDAAEHCAVNKTDQAAHYWHIEWRQSCVRFRRHMAGI